MSKWINTLWYGYTIFYYSPIKKKNHRHMQWFGLTWKRHMKEISQIQTGIYCLISFTRTSRIGRSNPQWQRWSMFAEAWGRGIDCKSIEGMLRLMEMFFIVTGLYRCMYLSKSTNCIHLQNRMYLHFTDWKLWVVSKILFNFLWSPNM